MSNNQNLYDNIINATVVNMFSFSKDGKIIIMNFNSKDKKHLYLFEVAKNVCFLLNNPKREIYLHMKLIPYLIFKIKNRKYNFHRFTKKTKIEKNKIIYPTVFLEYICNSFNNNIEIISDLYNKYYKN